MENKNIDVSLLRTGDILLTGGNSWLSKKIKQFTNSKYNHIGMICFINNDVFVIEEDRTGGGLLKLQAGLIATPIENYIKSNYDLLIRRPYFDIDEDKYREFMISKLGKFKYSYWDLIVAQPIHQLFNVWIGGTSMKDNKTVCSGFVGYLFHTFNKNLFRNWYQLAPADFVKDRKFFTLF